MKKYLSKIITVIACICLCFSITGCGNKSKLEVYEGTINYGSMSIPVELIVDDSGVATIVGNNSSYIAMGGKCEIDGDNYKFTTLNGSEITTGKLKGKELTLNYGGMAITFEKSEKTYNVEKECGAYKGYVSDSRPFELCLVLRAENKYFIIEEDGDIHSYGTYEVDKDLLTLTEFDSTSKYAFGNMSDDKIELNIKDDKIVFQKY